MRQFVPNKTYPEIEKALGISRRTARAICERFKERGTVVRPESRSRGRILTEEQVDELCGKELLKRWAAKSLPERIYLVKDYFHLDKLMHPTTLWNYYQSRGIKYLKANYHWTSRHNPTELQKL